MGLQLASLLPRAWMGVVSARSLSVLSLGCLAGPWAVRTALNFSRVVLEFGHRMALRTTVKFKT